ncbi:hypothetical protein CR513_20248, partial [Mucuna pruriens]
MAGEWEEELHRQLAIVKAIVEKPGGEVAPPPALTTQAFWAQPFSEEIDETTILPNFREVVIEPFDGTQDPIPIFKPSKPRCTSARTTTDLVASYS